MKTALLTVTILLLFSSCKQYFSPVDVVLKDSINTDITVELTAEHLDAATAGTDFLYSTYSITNNAEKNFDSVKVVFTAGTTITSKSYIPMLANEGHSVTIYHAVFNEVKYTVQWW